MRSSRIFRSLAIWSSAAALVGSVTVATLDAQNKKGSTKPSKSSASKTATAPAKIDYKGSPSVLKTSFGEVPLGEFEAAFRRSGPATIASAEPELVTPGVLGVGPEGW